MSNFLGKHSSSLITALASHTENPRFKPHYGRLLSYFHFHIYSCSFLFHIYTSPGKRHAPYMPSFFWTWIWYQHFQQSSEEVTTFFQFTTTQWLFQLIHKFRNPIVSLRWLTTWEVWKVRQQTQWGLWLFSKMQKSSGTKSKHIGCEYLRASYSYLLKHFNLHVLSPHKVKYWPYFSRRLESQVKLSCKWHLLLLYPLCQQISSLLHPRDCLH